MLPVNPPQRQDACSQNDYSTDTERVTDHTHVRSKHTNTNLNTPQTAAGPWLKHKSTHQIIKDMCTVGNSLVQLLDLFSFLFFLVFFYFWDFYCHVQIGIDDSNYCDLEFCASPKHRRINRVFLCIQVETQIYWAVRTHGDLISLSCS